jgi:hypothetical protein
VAGNPDQHPWTIQVAHFSRREAIPCELDAAGRQCHRKIDPIVDDQRRSGAIGYIQDLLRQTIEIYRAQVFFPQLDRRNATRNGIR